MAERDRAPVRVDVRRVVGDAVVAQHRQRLRGERFVQLDHIDVGELDAALCEHPSHRRRRAEAHDARRDPCGGGGEHLRLGGEAVFLHRFGRRKQHGARAIVDARRVARGHRAIGPDDTLEPGQRFEARLARMLVAVDDDRVALLLRNRDGHDLLGEPSGGDRRRRALLAAQGEGVLVGTRDLELGGNVFRRFWHRVDTVLCLHDRIDEPPADSRVLDLRTARECALGLGHHERRA